MYNVHPHLSFRLSLSLSNPLLYSHTPPTQNNDLSFSSFYSQAEVFREDFLTERKDREAAHTQRNELEERYKAETNNLKEQLQRVGADNGRLTQQMERERASHQQQLAEKHKHVQDLMADKHTLQVGIWFSASGME